MAFISPDFSCRPVALTFNVCAECSCHFLTNYLSNCENNIILTVGHRPGQVQPLPRALGVLLPRPALGPAPVHIHLGDDGNAKGGGHQALEVSQR